MKRLLSIVLFWPTILFAHIGSPVVIADGVAGPYPLRVVIRPPDVIPGRAQIDVQLLRPVDVATQVFVLPVTAAAGLHGAPAPDEAIAVVGDPALRHGELWLMTVGSYSVHVTVRGPAGTGTFIVPVDAIATQVLPMPKATEVILAVLGLILFLGAISLAAAAAKEGTLDPAQAISRRDRSRGFLVGFGALVFFGYLLFAGKSWWDRADVWHRSNEIYHPLPLSAQVSHGVNGSTVLQLAIDTSKLDSDEPLSVLPDHGKLMHLFVMREPKLDVFAHLHPVQVTPGNFVVTLPALPPGDYTLYADITSKMGFAATLTTRLALPPSPAASLDQETSHADASAGDTKTSAPSIDPDDAWINADWATRSKAVPATLEQVGEKTFYADMPLSLNFRAVNGRGEPIESEPYMGMLGHAAIRKTDGSVFAHLHPLGTISMASQDFFATQAAQQTRGIVKQLPELCEAGVNVSFPYEFPSAGAYQIWVQTRVKGEIVTGVFDLNVLPPK